MKGWHEIPGAGQLKPGEMTHGVANGEDVLVLNLGEEFRAYFNRCGHMNAPMDLGTFKSGMLKCAQHNAVFDAKTGEVRGQPVLGMSGLDMSKLPKEFLDQMGRMMPIFERTPCRALTPVPVVTAEGKVKVWV